MTLTREGRQRLARRDPANIEAYQLYLKGRYFWNKRTAEGFRQAISCYEQAIERDPNYALAFVGLADMWLLIGGYDVASQQSAIPQARLAAEKALELDPTSLIINTDLGKVLILARQYEQAAAQLRRTLEMDADFAQARYWLANVLMHQGHYEAALAEWRRAKRIEDKPLFLSLAYLSLQDRRRAFSFLDKVYAERVVGLIALKTDPVFDPLRSDPRFTELLRRMQFPEPR